MYNKLNARPFAVLILIILVSTFYSCKPGFLIQPPVNNKIYAETDAGGTHYYSYFNFLNTSGLTCNVSIEKPFQLLKLISPMPLTLAPNASTEVKFEIIGFNQSLPCPAPCVIEEMQLKGVWPLYSDPSYFVEQKPVVQWSAPLTRVDCWVPTDPVGDIGNYYKSPLRYYTSPVRSGGNGGMQYHWPQIGEVYNPNNFDIKILVDHKPNPAYICYTTDNPSIPDFRVWKDLAAHSSFDYGSTIKTNFGSCLIANPDAYIYIWQPAGLYTLNNDNTKWIALKVTLLP